MPPVIAALLVVNLIVVSAWLVSVHLVLRHVQRVHPDAYESMGRPHVLMNNTRQNTGPVLGFILGQRYRVLQDPVLDRLGNRARVVFFAAALSVTAMFLLFLADLIGAPVQM